MSKLFIKDRFATTPNSLLYNPNITLRAKGLFAFIQGKPDKWNFSAERISFENKEGLQSIRSALKELEQFGFLQRVKNKNEKGHWEIDYILYSEPINPADENPTLETRPTETHSTENPTLENHTNNNNTEVIKKDNTSINNKINNKISFDVFWDLYGKKRGSKTKAEKKWNKLSIQVQEKIIKTLPSFKKSISDFKFLPFPETYLNNERWNDELNIISEIEGETKEQRERREYIEQFKNIKIH